MACLTTALVLPLLGQSFLTNGLVAYYPFDGNADDKSGRGNNGTVIGATLSWDRFNDQKAMAFNGVDQYIVVPHQDYLNFPSGDFTITFWAFLNDPAKTQYILGKDMGPGDTDKWIIHYGPELGGTNQFGPAFLMGAAPSPAVLYAPSSFGRPDAYTWHFYSFRKSGTNLTINFDAFGIGGGTCPLALPNGNTAPLTIGQSETAGFMDGRLDEIRIYNRALSGDEIASLYRFEADPQVTLVKAVKPSFSRLIVGASYILQVSTDLVTWTNQGKIFTATGPTMDYPQYWDVDNSSTLYFRLWHLGWSIP